MKIRDGIEFDFRVTNSTPRKLEAPLPTGQTHEVVVVDSLGREVWRWSAGRMFTQALQNKLVDPARPSPGKPPGAPKSPRDGTSRLRPS